ncbi:hypothetical protein [Erythrobacter sp. THAF29]|uniref:hypothetical protein n=1 Tax=Erythrobacter sp. THAF29 TaxID=2587851 RepID=UPI0012682B0F|nr:hypothetical protein [Erythrobacter sp. THAF29]QFT77482.1 hypothetical protein FIU90_08025 [Erythrobacter sp. THAF29]
MKITRRSTILGSFAAASGTGAATIAGCAPGEPGSSESLTKVTVIGAIHARHRDSRRYSLDVLREALRRAEPDIVLSELPPSQIEEARRSFAETGEVSVPRARAFPELSEAVFPLSQEMGFIVEGCAGWSRQLADNRSQRLAMIENDRARAKQWAEHQAARAEYAKAVRGRSDDPRFIHTREYDAIVQRAQTPYQVYFDPDLGPGGWTRINRAHTDLIETALNSIRGQGTKALVIFGAWHKYMIERVLMLRGDVELLDARTLFP